MSHPPHITAEPDQPTIYHIRVKGHLGARWERWFEPLAIAPQPNGDTLLIGPLADQAALHGIIKRIRDLGLPLISMERIEPGSPASRNEGSTT